MRRFLFLSAVAALSFATPSFAGAMPDAASLRQASPVELATHYYGHKPKCFFKKIKKHDYYGKVVIRKVKVCH